MLNQRRMRRSHLYNHNCSGVKFGPSILFCAIEAMRKLDAVRAAQRHLFSRGCVVFALGMSHKDLRKLDRTCERGDE